MDLKRVIIPLLLIMPFAVKGQEYWPEPSENQLTDLLAQTDEKVGLKEDETDDATLVALQMFEKGKTAFDRKEYTEAAEWYRKAAEQGLAEAQNNLGLLYEYEESDLRKAKKWYRKAAKQGDIRAIDRLKELGVPVGEPQ